MTYLDPVAGGFRESPPTSAALATLDSQTIPQSALGLRSVTAHTADAALTAADSGSIRTNAGASGTVTLTLPAAVVGLEYFFGVRAAQALRIDPSGNETISLPSTGVPGAAGKYLVADAVGETVHLMCVAAGTWAVMGYTGTWTAEP